MVQYLTEECRFAFVVAAAAASVAVVTGASVWEDSNHLQNRSKSQHPPRKQPLKRRWQRPFLPCSAQERTMKEKRMEEQEEQNVVVVVVALVAMPSLAMAPPLSFPLHRPMCQKTPRRRRFRRIIHQSLRCVEVPLVTMSVAIDLRNDDVVVPAVLVHLVLVLVLD